MSRLRRWGQGSPALALHCSLAHGAAWDGVARVVGDRLALIAPDLVGHGQGPAQDPAQDYHDQVTAEVAQYLPPDSPTHLIGHSFGATVALRLAIEMPARVASLTLIEPVLFAAAGDRDGNRAHRAAMARMNACLKTGDTRAAAEVFLSVWGGAVPFDRMPPAQQAYMADRVWVIPASHPALSEDRAGLLPRLGALECPVLLVEGDGSPPVISEIQDALARRIPGARRRVIRGAGHMVPISHPDETGAEIRAFLEDTA